MSMLFVNSFNTISYIQQVYRYLVICMFILQKLCMFYIQNVVRNKYYDRSNTFIDNSIHI